VIRVSYTALPTTGHEEEEEEEEELK